MKFNLIMIIFTVLLMSACASSPDYVKADKLGDEGYSESVLEKNRYQVTFTGDSTTSDQEVKNYALLRSAELTMEKGYDWFEVITRDSESTEVKSGNNAGVAVSNRPAYVRDCGLLGCTTRSNVGTEIRSTAISDSRTEHKTTLEIVMQNGDAPANNSRAYNAAKIAESLRKNLGK